MSTPKQNLLGYVPAGLAADRPAAPTPASGLFLFYFATDTHALSAWDPTNSEWVVINELDALKQLDLSSPPPAAGDRLRYDGTDWVNVRPPYIVGFSAPQTSAYSASQVLGQHRFAKAVTIPANFGAHLGLASQAGGTANATGSPAFNVDKAASASPNSFSNVGTITIGSGGVVPTFASSGGSAITFSQGDVVRVVAPSSPDATFVGFYATLVGYET